MNIFNFKCITIFILMNAMIVSECGRMKQRSFMIKSGSCKNGKTYNSFKLFVIEDQRAVVVLPAPPCSLGTVDVCITGDIWLPIKYFISLFRIPRLDECESALGDSRHISSARTELIIRTPGLLNVKSVVSWCRDCCPVWSAARLFPAQLSGLSYQPGNWSAHATLAIITRLSHP